MGLDRKTKDVDASIELLEDRMKQDKIWETITGIIVIMMLLAAVSAIILATFLTDDSVSENPSDVVRLLIGFTVFSALIVIEWTSHLYYTKRQHDLSLLIYLKRHERKR